MWSCFLRATTDERAATDENNVMVMLCDMLVLFVSERERDRERDHSISMWDSFTCNHLF